MIIRDMKFGDIDHCARLVRDNWGQVAADRAKRQMLEMFDHGARFQCRPHFYVADVGTVEPAGFAAFCADMMMAGSFDLIWIVVAQAHKGRGIGAALTNARLDEIRVRGGTMVSLMTQKPDFFRPFGFRVLDVHDGWVLMNQRLGTVSI